jgi:tetratricopeptide (TPR) repeat protein
MGMRMSRFTAVWSALRQTGEVRLALLTVVSLAGCTLLSEEEGSISRGDQAYAKGDPVEALAEYRLALRQGATDPETHARIAHTYVALQRIDEAREHYRLAASADSSWADQAVADFVRLAREEERARDRFGMASAVQTALEFRPGISLEDLALPLAEHYSDIGEYGRAIPFFQKSLSSIDPDSFPGVLFEAAVAYDEVGDCETAAVYYEEYRVRTAAWRRSEVDWRLGNCSFRLARTKRSKGEDDEALRHLETLLTIGEPRNLLAMAYFEKGEILGYRGECQGAIEAFRQVPIVDPSGSGPLVDRAEERIDQIRFGRGPGGLLNLLVPRQDSGSCFPPDPDRDPAPGVRRRGD